MVHATGKLNSVTDKKVLHDLLARLIGKFEDREKSNYDFAKVPQALTYSRMEGLIGFEMEIEFLEGKFKLGQQANAADQQSLLRNLQSASPGALDAPIHRRFLQAPEGGHGVARSQQAESPAIRWARRRRSTCQIDTSRSRCGDHRWMHGDFTTAI